MSPNPRKAKKSRRKSGTSSSRRAIFRCKHCNLSFPTKHSLIVHAKNNLPSITNDNGNKCLQALEQCPYCEEYWPNQSSLNLHLIRNPLCKRRKDLDDSVNELNYTSFENIDLHHQSSSTTQILSSTTNIEPSVTLNVTQHAASTSQNPRYSSKSSNQKRPSFDPNIMTSNHLFDISLLTLKHKPNDTLVHFYTELLSHSRLFQNKEESCKLNFKSLYIEISNLVSQIQIEHETVTLPGYETKYLFSNICHSDVYHFLSSICSKASQSLLSQSSQESIIDDLNEEIFSDQDHYQDEDLDTNDQDVFPSIRDRSIMDTSIQMKEARKHSIYSITDEAMLELHHILKGTNAPLYLFDELTSWCQSFSGAFGRKGDRIDSRETFLKHLGDKVNSPVVTESMKPIIEQHELPSGGEITITRFDFKSNIASLLSNEELMKEENLLIDAENPFSVPQEGCILDDLNSGWWHRETHEEICTRDNELLLPIILFIDGGKITERLSVEPIVFTLGIFNRATRNLPSAWRTLGYIENVYNSTDTEAATKNAEAKARDYHSIIERHLQEIISIQGIDGGFNWLLRCGQSLKDVVFKIAIQSVLGDCEGLEKLCAKLGGHNLQMKLLCRECKVSPVNSDNPDHICQFITKDDITNKSREELAQLSIRPIRNAFRDVYFGARSLTIHECTPPEPLHQTRLGIVKYLFEMFLSIVPPKTFEMMNQYVRYIYRNHSRQSCRDYPDISPFENGLTNPGTISAEFQYSRLFAIYLCFLSPPIYKSIATRQKSRRVVDPNNAPSLRFEALPPLGYARTKDWFELIQGTLSYYQFLMSPQHQHSTINVTRDGHNILETEPLSQHYIRQYMHKYKFLVGERKGHGLCIPKFHENLHHTREISKDASLQNIDTGRPESNAVPMYKRLSSQTQLRKQTVIRQVALRHYEDLLATEARRLAQLKIQNTTSPNHSQRTASHQCSKFELSLNNIHSPDEEIDGEFDVLTYVSLHWMSDNARGTFPPDILSSIVKRLFLNTSDGGCLAEGSKAIGFTEYLHMNSTLFRAHPNYRNEGKEWFDWCNLKWEGLDEAIPSQIITFLDLQQCTFRTIEEMNSLRVELGHRVPDNEDDIDLYHDYLTDGKFIVVRSAMTTQDSEHYIDSQLENYITEVNFLPRLAKRVVLEDKCRIVPVDTIESACYAVPMFMEKQDEEKETYIVCNDIRSWKDAFETQYNRRV